MRKLGWMILGAAVVGMMGCAGRENGEWVKAEVRAGEVAVGVRVHAEKAGAAIPAGFSGASFEMRMVQAGAGQGPGGYFFDASDKAMVGMFRGLGIKSLRVGGNSLDRAEVDAVRPADIDALYAFARAAGVKVIYSVKMRDVETPEEIAVDVAQVKYLWGKYAELTEAVTIGNEPNIYFADTAPGGVGTAPAGAATKPAVAVLGGVGDSGAVGIGYKAYRKRWEEIAGAIVKEVPGVRLCGPSSTPGKVAWAGAFAKDEGSGPLAKNLVMVTQHSYPGGNAQKVTDSGAGRELILSPKMEAGYEKFYATMVPAVMEAGKEYRLEESNSLFHGGATNISNTAASALWGLDFMWWWATHGAEGINFHTGMNRAGAGRVPGGYDLFWRSPERIEVHPMGYGVKAFDVAGGGGRGRVVPVEVSAGGANLTAYGARDGREVFVTVINRENVHGELKGARDVAAGIDVGSGQWRAEVIYLRGPKGELGAVRGMTLGGAEIGGDGRWEGKWEAVGGSGGRFVVHVPAGEAAVVRLGRN
ncbi:MAG: hypothetical protein ACTHN5_03695 [Phycisphaerae bacterium]